MTTAELIKKREEGQNKPAEQTIPSFQYKSSTTLDDEQLGVSPVVTEQPEEKTLLYDAGKAAQGVAKMPVSTDETNEFYKTVFTPEDFGVETPEQAAARERRDFIKQGLTGFTEGLSALANLYYTTKGAPSQKLTSQMPELSKRLYAERLERDKKLENFRAWQRAKAAKDADRAYQEGIRKEKIARQDAIRAKTWEREDQKLAQAQENADRNFEYKVEQDKQEREDRIKQQEESNKQFWATHNRLNAGNTSSSSSSVMHGKNGTSILNTKNGFMDVDWKKVDPVAKQQLYKIVPEEIRNKYPLKDKFGTYDEKYATSQMNAAIAEAAVEDEKIAKWLVDSKAGVYQQQATNPIHGNTQQANASATENPWVESDSYETWAGGDAETLTNWGKENPANSGTQQTMSNDIPTPPQTEKQATDVPQEEKPKPKGKDRYKSMVSSDKKEAEAERKAKEERIKKAYEKRANTVEEAKKLRAELNAILNEDLTEFDIEQFIKDNNIGVLDAIKYRLKYSDDDKERAKIKRKIQRLNDIIGNN